MMGFLLFISIIPFTLILGGIYIMGQRAQQRYDAARSAFTIIYPKDTKAKQVQAFLWSITNDLIPNSGDNGATPTLDIEVRWTPNGIRHVLKMNPQDESHVLSMLEAYLPGITIDPVDTPEETLTISPAFAVDVMMTDMTRMLGIREVDELATGILHSVSGLGDGEVVAYQVIIGHTTKLKIPGDNPQKSHLTLKDFALNRTQASKEEVAERKQKVVEQNFNLGIRISAQAADERRGQQLVGSVLKSLRAAQTKSVAFKTRTIRHNTEALINNAYTPDRKHAQVTLTELSALIAPVVGNPDIPGLPTGAAKRIAPTESIPKDNGRFIGYSNVTAFSRRPIYQSFDIVDKNTGYFGPTGTGKSVAMANAFADDVRSGMGAIVIDASISESKETLYSRARDVIPPERVSDVIDNHIRNNAMFPVAFNLFKQGMGLGAIDQIEAVFTNLYPDIAKGVSVRDLLHHATWTLIEADLNFVDIDPLLRPRNDTERRWAARVVNEVSRNHDELNEYWTRMKDKGFLSSERSKKDSWERYTDPLYNRLWQLLGRPEIRYMIGQTETALSWEDVLLNNKIVLISLAGLPEETAQLMASLLVDSLWAVAQRIEPTRSNSLYLDEFQAARAVRGGLDQMLSRNRKHKLPASLGTQYVVGIPSDIEKAIYNNVNTRILFPLNSADEARTWATHLGTDKVTAYDLQHSKPHEVFVQMPTDDGNQVVTVKARPPEPPTGYGLRAAELSRQKYGVHIDEVKRQITERRRGSELPQNDIPQGSVPIPEE